MKLTEKLAIINEFEETIQQDRMNREALVALIISVAKRVTQSDRGSLFIFNRQTQQLESELADGMSTKLYLNIGEGIAGEAAKQQNIINEMDVDTTKSFNSEIDLGSGYVTRNTIAVPILEDTELIGVIQLLNKASGNYDEQDEQLLLGISGLVACYLDI